MRDRFLHLIGGTAVLVGAFGIGWVLHRSFFVGDLGIASPAAVITLALSAVAIVVGRRLETAWDPTSVLPEEPTAEDESEDDFDAEFSPLDDDSLEGYERDESK
ncbi:MAG TPA: hypothetical protein VJ898_12515 [Natrialbaceae archaeon]|nr:hypothetical protein [Natrialbaceae archaeon]